MLSLASNPRVSPDGLLKMPPIMVSDVAELPRLSAARFLSGTWPLAEND
jgi:hypothetical protein